MSMREMSMREGEGDEGGDERESEKIDGDSKKTNKKVEEFEGNERISSDRVREKSHVMG